MDIAPMGLKTISIHGQKKSISIHGHGNVYNIALVLTLGPRSPFVEANSIIPFTQNVKMWYLNPLRENQVIKNKTLHAYSFYTTTDVIINTML